ncbi:MAG: DUF924 family protein [Anaerolineae bacterium]
MKWEEIISFWFEEIEPAKHWVKDAEFDELLRTRFGAVHTAATKGELYQWRETPNGRLAEIIVLDQFSRNMFRDTPASFAYDTIALVLAQEAIAAGADKEVNPEHVSFMYMPFMHSESAAIHDVSMKLFGSLGSLEFEEKHKVIIDRFGRYPHRNEILGRVSTLEEIEFMKGPDSSF